MDPVNDPKSPAQKPGWRSSEFWISLASMIVGALLASGLIADDSTWGKLLGMAAMLLTSLGYQVSRTVVKASGNKAAAVASVANPTQPQ